MIEIHCLECDKFVDARHTTGEEIYPHRPDLHRKHFYKCDTCNNYVGCHRDGGPLGSIPNMEMRRIRQRIHKILDPLWQSGRVSRNKLYKRISHEMGWRFHTAHLKSMEEAEKAYQFILTMENDYE